jgi:hypothetical protein
MSGYGVYRELGRVPHPRLSAGGDFDFSPSDQILFSIFDFRLSHEQVLIRQGIEAHRPSELFVRANKPQTKSTPFASAAAQ